MPQRIRDFLASAPGRILTIGLIVASGVVIYTSFTASFGSNEAIQATRARVFVCAETGKSFTLELQPGMKMPVKSPFTSRETGYAFDEVCYWTTDGKVSDSPTYILLNGTAGKTGATFCPECQRLVVRNNPPAGPNRKPPPTEEEFRRIQLAR